MEGICQSCGMPISGDKLSGTNEDGSKNAEYCCFCLKDGEFTFNGSFDDFVEMQVKIAVEKLGMGEAEARKMANNTLPKLKRWKK